MKRDLQQSASQWQLFQLFVPQLIIYFGFHYFHWMLCIALALAANLTLAVGKYFFYSDWEWFFLTIGHSLVLWIIAIASAAILAWNGSYWLAATVAIFHLGLGAAMNLPGSLFDAFVARYIGSHPARFAIEQFVLRDGID